MVLIYQIEIAMEITDEFTAWLEKYVEDNLLINNIVTSKWWKRPPDSNKREDGIVWTLQFHLVNERALKDFEKELAPGLLEEARRLFGDRWKGEPVMRVMEEEQNGSGINGPLSALFSL